MLKYIFFLLGITLLGLGSFNVYQSAKAMEQHRKLMETWADKLEQKTSQDLPTNLKDSHSLDESINGLEYAADFIDAKKRNRNGWWGVCIGLFFSCTACFEFLREFIRNRSREKEAELEMNSPAEDKPSGGKFWRSS